MEDDLLVASLIAGKPCEDYALAGRGVSFSLIGLSLLIRRRLTADCPGEAVAALINGPGGCKKITACV